MPEIPKVVSYKINGRDELVHVNENWFQFAQQNQAGETLSELKILGKSLWSFVRDPSLQIIYRSLLSRVRLHAASIL